MLVSLIITASRAYSGEEKSSIGPARARERAQTRRIEFSLYDCRKPSRPIRRDFITPATAAHCSRVDLLKAIRHRWPYSAAIRHRFSRYRRSILIDLVSTVGRCAAYFVAVTPRHERRHAALGLAPAAWPHR